MPSTRAEPTYRLFTRALDTQRTDQVRADSVWVNPLCISGRLSTII
jgi:hypothetical protein